MDQIPFAFRVIDLKQYVYCPRILYYQTVLPEVRPLTYKMEAGIQAHIQVEEQEKRRSLRAYDLAEGQRRFNVSLSDAGLMLSGEIDMVIETDHELIPVDYKQAKKIGKHYKLQLMAYGRLLELSDLKEKRTIKRGFLYLIPTRQAIEVQFTASLRRQLTEALQAMYIITWQQQIPPPVTKPAQCVNCEFRRFCNDIG